MKNSDESEFPALVHGTTVALSTFMEFVCRHCSEICDGDPYRVISQENGVVLLDMIVCYQCSLEARDLALSTQKIELPRLGIAQVLYH
jgi:hypothetical protein